MKSKARNRVALVFSQVPSRWFSCQIIASNLRAAYRVATAGNVLKTFSLTPSMRSSQVIKLAHSIKRFNPTHIAFVDQVPHPKTLICSLKEVYGNAPFPTLHIHIYGDFTLFTPDWLALEKTLADLPIHFFCASQNQTTLISNLLHSSDSRTPVHPSISTCPFPVDVKTFRCNPDARKSYRKKLHIEKNELLWVYTGRLSLQKNISRLIDEVKSFVLATGIPVHLVLAGPYDDVGSPFFGVKLKKGSMHRFLSGVFSSSIRHLGNLHQAELASLYNAADLYLSLSLHHDEDFGMSPAESLCCGTPVLLTGWGGFPSFKIKNALSPFCELIPVNITQSGLRIETREIQKNLFFSSLHGHSGSLRKQRSKIAQDQWSINAVAKIIQKKLSEEAPRFNGFSWFMQEHARRMSRPIPFPEGPRSDSFYEAFYTPYTVCPYA